MREEVIKIRGRGIVTLPQQIRKDAGINDGDYVKITSKDNEILMEKVEIKSIAKSKKNNNHSQ